jgi:4-hydroxy-tetrahydrodipicolinate synthase
MSDTPRPSGTYAPVLMPFKADLSVDTDRLIDFCHWLIAQKSKLAIFGTNSEANSLCVEERIDILDQVIEAGISPDDLMPGTGCCAIADTVKLSAHASKHGCGGVLMLPPFYYKGVSDEGLYRSYSEIVERVGDERLRIYLYHIPPIAQVGISLELIERLTKAYPDTIAGMKDSSGEWSNTKAVLENFPDLDMFCGSEGFLLDTMRLGGKGCISAIANIRPQAIQHLYENWQSEEAVALQRELIVFREILTAQAPIPSLKCAVSHCSANAEWSRLRPPLVELDEVTKQGLSKALKAYGFHMPGFI